MKPVRLQRSRRKGSKLVSPNGLPVVCVSRGTKWGNPFKASDFMGEDGKPGNKRLAVERFRLWLHGCYFYETDLNIRLKIVLDSIGELRGKNLACWCKIGEPCHADVLLEIANEEKTCE